MKIYLAPSTQKVIKIRHHAELGYHYIDAGGLHDDFDDEFKAALDAQKNNPDATIKAESYNSEDVAKLSGSIAKLNKKEEIK